MTYKNNVESLWKDNYTGFLKAVQRICEMKRVKRQNGVDICTQDYRISVEIRRKQAAWKEDRMMYQKKRERGEAESIIG